MLFSGFTSMFHQHICQIMQIKYMTKNKKKNINKLYKTSDSSLIFIVHAKVGLMLTCSLNKLHCHLMVISSKWESEDEKFIQQPAQSGVCKRKTAGGWGCVTLTPRQCSPLRLVKSPECSLHQATHTHTQRPAVKTLNRYKTFGYYFCDFFGR